MNDTMLYSLAAQANLAKRMDAIADNIANASTTGYKREDLQFGDYLSKIGTAGKAEPEQVVRDYSDGNMTHTGNPLDLAIRGEGFFSVEVPQGVGFTRDGRFTIDREGNLVDAEGNKVLGEDGGPITFSPTDTDIRITPDGSVIAGNSTIGTLAISRFAHPQSLERAGNSLYLSDGQHPVPATGSEVVQGALEDSNVVPILEITKMMEVLRGFQQAQKMITDQHDLIRKTIQTFGQVA